MTVPIWLTEVQHDARLRLWVTADSAATTSANEWLIAGLTVRTLRGSKMRSTPALMDETSAALQFPDYFGANWDALDECLSDMEWLKPCKGIVIVIHDAEQVLIDESAEQLEVFVSVLRSASNEYSRPVERGEEWDRPATPFHVVLQALPDTADVAERRWSRTSAQLAGWSS